MWRVTAVIASALLISACGGGGIDSYEEATEAYADVMKEMMNVLEDVTDESSAEKAAGKIENLGNRLAEITKQVEDLPQPSAAEMQKIAEKQIGEMQAFQQDAVVQMMKIAQYPVLQDAWLSAMENMR